jgi:hypothetical protein
MVLDIGHRVYRISSIRYWVRGTWYNVSGIGYRVMVY